MIYLAYLTFGLFELKLIVSLLIYTSLYIEIINYILKLLIYTIN